MSTTSHDLRERLQSLSIPREQRPASAGRAGSASRSLLVWILLLAVLGMGGYIAWRQSGGELKLPESFTSLTQSQVEVRTVRVAAPARAGTQPLLTATGKMVSDHQVEVSTKVSGQVVALYFEQGDRVQAGQLLARIESESYKARRDEAAAMLARSRAQLAFQKINFERIDELFRAQRASEIEHADARRSLDEAAAQLAASEAMLIYTDKMYRDTEVTAPIAGVVLERNVEVGDFVAAEGGRGAMANSQFAAIADMTKLRVEVDVSELDIARLTRGMPCKVVPDAYKDRRYHGHILWIDPGANYAKATVQVKVRIDEPDDYLRVEGTAQVQFLPNPSSDSAATQPINVWIPQEAFLPDAGASGGGNVFVVADGRLHQTQVKTGRVEGNRIEVLSGLREGQEIATENLDKLRDGQPVKR